MLLQSTSTCIKLQLRSLYKAKKIIVTKIKPIFNFKSIHVFVRVSLKAC